MGTVHVLVEVHVPGLDLHHERLLRHRLFMDVVHQNAQRVAAFAWHCYLQEGRGAVFVDQQQWREGIKAGGWAKGKGVLLPFTYLPTGAQPVAPYTELWAKSYADLIRAYDPEEHVVLVVDTPPEQDVSLYLLLADPSPPAAYRLTQAGEHDENG